MGYVVPFSIYPDWYHCKWNLPLPFINLASQKNFIALYHMWIYANKDLLNWFISEYPKHYTNKLDMWKWCIRFKNIKKIPYELIWELVSKITVQDRIYLYESKIKN
jgi:hypothetical protein